MKQNFVESTRVLAGFYCMPYETLTDMVTGAQKSGSAHLACGITDVGVERAQV